MKKYHAYFERELFMIFYGNWYAKMLEKEGFTVLRAI